MISIVFGNKVSANYCIKYIKRTIYQSKKTLHLFTSSFFFSFLTWLIFHPLCSYYSSNHCKARACIFLSLSLVLILARELLLLCLLRRVMFFCVALARSLRKIIITNLKNTLLQNVIVFYTITTQNLIHFSLLVNLQQLPLQEHPFSNP